MPRSNRSILHLHFLVFIWGFTSILGALIHLDALSLVWYRVVMAVAMIALYFLVFSKQSFVLPKEAFGRFLLGGVLISVHWILFFYAIKISSISVTLSVLSSASLMTSFLEPLFYKRKIKAYEVFFGCLVILGLGLIFEAESDQYLGILVALACTLLSVLFSLLNGKLIDQYPAKTISFYQLTFGAIFMSLWMLIYGLPKGFFQVSASDWLWLFLLASICTAYAFIASVDILKHITPYTLMISLNMEPIYAILFSLLIFGEKELMHANFYLGVLIILLSVVGNAMYKLKNKKKKINPL